MKKELLKKGSALKKELLRKISSCLNLKKVTMRKCEEMAFPKLKLSENIATYARREIVNLILISASHSIFQSFVTSLISVCFAVMNNFFNHYIKKLLKSRKDWLLSCRSLHQFPVFTYSLTDITSSHKK